MQHLLKTRAEEIIKRPSPSRSPLAQRQDRKRAEERAKQQEEDDSYNAMTAKLTEDEKFYLESTLKYSISTPPEMVRAQLSAYRQYQQRQKEEKRQLEEQLDRNKTEREAEIERDEEKTGKKKDRQRIKEEERKGSRSPRRDSTAAGEAASSKASGTLA